MMAMAFGLLNHGYVRSTGKNIAGVRDEKIPEEEQLELAQVARIF